MNRFYVQGRHDDRVCDEGVDPGAVIAVGEVYLEVDAQGRLLQDDLLVRASEQAIGDGGGRLASKAEGVHLPARAVHQVLRGLNVLGEHRRRTAHKGSPKAGLVLVEVVDSNGVQQLCGPAGEW